MYLLFKGININVLEVLKLTQVYFPQGGAFIIVAEWEEHHILFFANATCKSYWHFSRKLSSNLHVVPLIILCENCTLNKLYTQRARGHCANNNLRQLYPKTQKGESGFLEG